MSHYTQDQIIANLKSAQAFEDKVFGDMGNTLFKEAAECIERLRAQLEAVTKERDEAESEINKVRKSLKYVFDEHPNYTIKQAINLLKTSCSGNHYDNEDLRERIETITAQRDRAMELLSNPRAAYLAPRRGAGGCADTEGDQWIKQRVELIFEIAKEKEGIE